MSSSFNFLDDKYGGKSPSEEWNQHTRQWITSYLPVGEISGELSRYRSQQGLAKSINNWAYRCFEELAQNGRLVNVAQTITRNLGDRANEQAKFCDKLFEIQSEVVTVRQSRMVCVQLFELFRRKLMLRWSENSKIRENKLVYKCNKLRSNAEGICLYKQWDDNRVGLA